MTKAHILRLARLRAAVTSGEAQRLRVASHLSINEVADACKVDQSTIWRWENGRRIPRGTAALRYAEFIDALQRQAAGGRESA